MLSTEAFDACVDSGSIQTAGERAIYITQNYHTGGFWSFQHLEMAVPVTELTPQQLGYFESESTHTLILRSIHVLKD